MLVSLKLLNYICSKISVLEAIVGGKSFNKNSLIFLPVKSIDLTAAFKKVTVPRERTAVPIQSRKWHMPREKGGKG